MSINCTELETKCAVAPHARCFTTTPLSDTSHLYTHSAEAFASAAPAAAPLAAAPRAAQPGAGLRRLGRPGDANLRNQPRVVIRSPPHSAPLRAAAARRIFTTLLGAVNHFGAAARSTPPPPHGPALTVGVASVILTRHVLTLGSPPHPAALPVTLRVAGGWVRDKLMGKESDDIDIALDSLLGREFAAKALLPPFTFPSAPPSHHHRLRAAPPVRGSACRSSSRPPHLPAPPPLPHR